jgi:hypothetical protein
MDSNLSGGNVAENTISGVYQTFREFLAHYGWPLLFVVALLYYFKPQLNKWQQDYALKRANNPHRVQILDEDLKRVRARQQLDHYKNIEKLASEETPKEPTTNSDLNDGS